MPILASARRKQASLSHTKPSSYRHPLSYIPIGEGLVQCEIAGQEDGISRFAHHGRRGIRIHTVSAHFYGWCAGHSRQRVRSGCTSGGGECLLPEVQQRV